MYSRIFQFITHSLCNVNEKNRQLSNVKCSKLRNIKQNNVCVFTRMSFKRPVAYAFSVCFLNITPIFPSSSKLKVLNLC